MKIVEFAGNSSIRVIDAEPPTPAPGQALIQRAASAICGSEMKAFRGAGMPGGNGGHEAVGTVLSLGDGVDSLRIGQRVGVSAVTGCGACHECARGRFTWCAKSKSYSRMHAEQFVIPASACHILPDDVPWKEATLLTGDGLGVPYHTSRQIDRADINTIAVIGLGPVGLGNVLLQAHLGRRIIGVDLVDYRLDFAKTLGADVTLKAGDELIDQIRDLTDGEGVDVAIDCAGARASVHSSFLAARKGGTVVFNGESNDEMLAPSRDFIRREMRALGVWYYFFDDFKAMLSLYRNGLDVGRLISHEIPLEDAAIAYDLFNRGVTGKALLTL